MIEKKYGKVASFRMDPDLHKELKRKSKNNGQSMSSVVEDLIRCHLGIKTKIDELKKEKKELIEKKKEIETKLELIEKKIEENKGKIPEEIKKYLATDFQNQPTGIQRRRVNEFADKLDMSNKEFVEIAREEVSEFEGLSGQTALDMEGEDEQ